MLWKGELESTSKSMGSSGIKCNNFIWVLVWDGLSAFLGHFAIFVSWHHSTWSVHWQMLTDTAWHVFAEMPQESWPPVRAPLRVYIRVWTWYVQKCWFRTLAWYVLGSCEYKWHMYSSDKGLANSENGFAFSSYETGWTRMNNLQTGLYHVQPMYKQECTKEKVEVLGIYHVYTHTYCFSIHFLVYPCLEPSRVCA